MCVPERGREGEVLVVRLQPPCSPAGPGSQAPPDEQGAARPRATRARPTAQTAAPRFPPFSPPVSGSLPYLGLLPGG